MRQARYITPFAFRAIDLFETMNMKDVNIKRTVYDGLYHANKRQRLCAKILTYCFYIIVLDIIENNVTFVLPLQQNKKAYIYVKPVTGEAFKYARQRGAYKDIDFLASNFTGYQLVFSWWAGKTARWKPIHISNVYKNKLTEKVNNGTVYC